jgi:alkylation response protein AidB-like acyl-CoA dehydrogenase
VKLGLDEGAQAFREELGRWLDENWPAEQERSEPKRSSGHLPGWARRWQRRLFDHGWLVPRWPPELGGRNATAAQQMIYSEELARRRIPRSLNPQGLSIIAPAIIQYGNEDQKQRYALPTLKGEITWCLGMSEPGAGSDLASLSTRAVLEQDRFVVDGQKVWTSGAQDADYCLCFVRTDPEAPKHRGISALIVDMASAGIAVRPLPDLTDPHHADFNEVFFEGVEVPAENLVGELNQGWAITQGSLSLERGMLWVEAVCSVERGLDALVELARRRSETGPQQAAMADQVASLCIDAWAMRVLGYRGFAKFARGEASPEHTILKLFSSEAERRVYLLGTEMLGPDALDMGLEGPSDASGWMGGPWAVDYLRSFSGTIAGGTSEIQRNIVAERVLGLPRS